MTNMDSGAAMREPLCRSPCNRACAVLILTNSHSQLLSLVLYNITYK